jgi:predicted amidohydrolase
MAANRGVVFGPDGAALARYDKIHMFDVDLDSGESWRESAVYQAWRDLPEPSTSWQRTAGPGDLL